MCKAEQHGDLKKSAVAAQQADGRLVVSVCGSLLVSLSFQGKSGLTLELKHPSALRHPLVWEAGLSGIETGRVGGFFGTSLRALPIPRPSYPGAVSWRFVQFGQFHWAYGMGVQHLTSSVVRPAFCWNDDYWDTIVEVYP